MEVYLCLEEGKEPVSSPFEQESDGQISLLSDESMALCRTGEKVCVSIVKRNK